MNKIEIRNVRKTLKGAVILDGLNMDLMSGYVYGLVGPNGSGKTMILRLLAGLIKANSGTLCYNDIIIGQKRSVSSVMKIGLTLENAGLYPRLTGLENLRAFASVRSMIDDLKIKESLEKVGLDPLDARPFHKYSLGMKQRLGIAQAIMENVDLLLLDEPTNALDENGADLVREIIRTEAKRGAIVVVASHNKDDIASCCDQVFAIKQALLMPT